MYLRGWLDSAGYEYFDESGYHFDALVENGFLDSVGAVSDWNTLKIVVKGDTIWFLVSGTPIGSAAHAGPLSGVPSMYIVSLDGAWVEWAFTNFNVYAVQQHPSALTHLRSCIVHQQDRTATGPAQMPAPSVSCLSREWCSR